MPIDDFERYPLTFGPSPVHPLKRLSAHLGGARVWAKREDVSSGTAFGGNKTRKLEYLVPDALAQGADTLVSIGGIQSNHTRQVAAVAAHLGLKCCLVQEKWVDWDDPVNDKVGNILLSRIMGADVRLDPSGFDIGIRTSWEEAIREVEGPGASVRHPCWRVGAPTRRAGVRQLGLRGRGAGAGPGVFFDTIVVCTVTGSTHAGMIAGFAALEEAGGPQRKVIGIDASATLDKTRAQVSRIARHRRAHRPGARAARGRGHPARGLGGRPLRHSGAVHHRRHSPVSRARGHDHRPGLRGKSMAGLVDLVTDGQIAPDSTVLYAHLGGQPRSTPTPASSMNRGSAEMLTGADADSASRVEACRTRRSGSRTSWRPTS